MSAVTPVKQLQSQNIAVFEDHEGLKCQDQTDTDVLIKRKPFLFQATSNADALTAFANTCSEANFMRRGAFRDQFRTNEA